MKKLIILIIAVLVGIACYSGYRYYNDTVKPENELQQCFNEQIRIYDSLKPDIQKYTLNGTVQNYDSTVSENENQNVDINSQTISEESVSEDETVPKNTEELYTEVQNVQTDDGVSDEIFTETENVQVYSENKISSENTYSDVRYSVPDENPIASAQDFNSDVVGWITVDGTEIDYPIVQGTDNEFYIDHGIDKKTNRGLGTPFLDYRNSPDFSDFNSILYAHNIQGKQMFARVLSFKKKDYFDSHCTGTLTTSDSIRKIKFFAYVPVDSNSALYNTVLITNSDKENYLKILLSSATVTDGTSWNKLIDKNIILLSTCTLKTPDSRALLAGFTE